MNIFRAKGLGKFEESDNTGKDWEEQGYSHAVGRRTNENNHFGKTVYYLIKLKIHSPMWLRETPPAHFHPHT